MDQGRLAAVTNKASIPGACPIMMSKCSVGVGELCSQSFRDQESHHPWILCVCQQRREQSTEDPLASFVRTRPGNMAVTLPKFFWPESLDGCTPAREAGETSSLQGDCAATQRPGGCCAPGWKSKRGRLHRDKGAAPHQRLQGKGEAVLFGDQEIASTPDAVSEFAGTSTAVLSRSYGAMTAGPLGTAWPCPLPTSKGTAPWAQPGGSWEDVQRASAGSRATR